MITGPRILVVEPDRAQAALMKRALLDRYPDAIVTVITESTAVMKEVRERRHDVAVLEYELHDLDGLKMLELLRQEDVDLPVIVISSNRSEQLASEAINFGAADFLVKENSYHLVLPRLILEALRRQTLIKRNRELEERLRASESVSAVSMTVATLAHEINNPLTTIMGIAELLTNEDALRQRGAKRKLKLIQRSANRIRTALHRLADMREPTVRHTDSGPMVEPETELSSDPTEG
jgi:two-component system, sensor histidine kinase and response regulator